MLKILSIALLLAVAAQIGFAADVSFRRVQIPDLKGRQTDAVLTFSDTSRSIEVHPVKGDAVSIPYAQVEKCSYEFTRKHRVVGGIVSGVLATPVTGVIVFLTHSRSHWLEIDYDAHDEHHFYVLRMHKKDYVHILEAVRTHVGIDAEVLGNADKRSR